MLKIWGRNTSVNVQKVMWAVGELALPHERIDVGGSFGKNNEPAYLAMNPNGLVPTVQDGDLVIWESNTIMRWLCATRGGERLHPPVAFALGGAECQGPATKKPGSTFRPGCLAQLC